MRMRKSFPMVLLAVSALALALLFSPIQPLPAEEGDPQVWTDKDVYSPGETVTISWSGFNENFVIQIRFAGITVATHDVKKDEAGEGSWEYYPNAGYGLYTIRIPGHSTEVDFIWGSFTLVEENSMGVLGSMLALMAGLSLFAFKKNLSKLRLVRQSSSL